MRSFLYSLVLVCLGSASLPAQEAWQEMLRFSSFDNVKTGSLAKGEVLSQRVSLPKAPLGISVETCYFVPGDVQKVFGAMGDDDSATKVQASDTLDKEGHYVMTDPATAADFAPLKLDASQNHVRNLINKSASKKLSLNLSKAEAAPLATAADPATLAEAWRTLLLGRATQFQAGGAAALSPFENLAQPFQTKTELLRMLQGRPKIQERFAGLLNRTFDKAALENESKPPSYYWETSKIQGDLVFSLGSFFSQSTTSGHRVAELVYYASSKYYCSLILYELWPATIEGKAGTFIWRGDYVITPDIPYLKGIERLAAESIMILEVKKSVKAFVSSIQ